MDPKIFQQQLNQLAEIEQVKVARSGAIREASDDDAIFRNGQTFEISHKNNPTLNIAVKSIKHKAKSCEDCGQTVCDRRVVQGRYQYPEPHWRKHCLVCNQVFNPLTGQYDIQYRSAQPFFTTYLKKRDK